MDHGTKQMQPSKINISKLSCTTKKRVMGQDERESSNRGRGRGRGEYYRNKYMKHSRGGRGGGGRSGRANSANSHQQTNFMNANQPQSGSVLAQTLLRIDGSSYGAYKQIAGTWNIDHSKSCNFQLIIDRVQSDPYATPSSLRCVVASNIANIPEWAYSTRSKRIALADFVTRKFAAACKSRRKNSGQHGVKGGEILIDTPGQHILERTSVVIAHNGSVEIRFSLGLPARGRTVLGSWAKDILCGDLPALISTTALSSALDLDLVKKHIQCTEDQEHLRRQVQLARLAAFVANGAILPREAGNSDRPMKANVIPFQSPKSLETTFEVPHAGQITGMGLPIGVSLIVGGGFHGKSTVLSALEKGIYNHIPGDGREFVCVNDSTVKIRAEDGRCVNSVDISPFINNLPFDKDTTNFTTPDASGSTSQAANIIEALELDCDTLLIDEDTCATNFMIRDSRMSQLVAKDKEPITPFISKVRPLFEEKRVSSILVIGGAGDYFDVADTVIMMDSYNALDVTKRAKEISAAHLSAQLKMERLTTSTESFGTLVPRFPIGSTLSPRGKVVGRQIDKLQYGEHDIELRAVEQLVERSQVNAIGLAMQQVASILQKTENLSMQQVLQQLSERLDKVGLDGLAGNNFKSGSLVRPRVFEIAAAINRLRGGRFRLR